jgi:methionyl-tRNA synthetase
MIASIVKKTFEGQVPHIHFDKLEEIDRELIAAAERSAQAAAKWFDAIAPNRALEAIWDLVLAANKYVDQTAPWNLAKNGDVKRLKQVAYTVLEALRWIGVMLWPVMPRKCDALRKQLGLPPLLPTVGVDGWPSAWGGLVGGTETKPEGALFPRFEKDQEEAVLRRLGVSEKLPTTSPSPSPTTTTSTSTATATSTITIDDVVKVELRVALVQSAEKVPKSDKLLKLIVDAGDGQPRQILAGIALHYAPEDLVGKRIVIVANLAPRKMMGLESNGMVLAASDEGGLSALFVDKPVAPGSKVK